MTYKCAKMSFLFLLRVVWLSDRVGSLFSQSRGAAPLRREQPGHLVALASGEDATWVSSWQGVSRMPNPGHAGGNMSPSWPGNAVGSGGRWGLGFLTKDTVSASDNWERLRYKDLKIQKISKAKKIIWNGSGGSFTKRLYIQRVPSLKTKWSI